MRAPVPAPAPAPVTLQAPVVGSDPTTAGAPEPVPVAASEPAPAPVAPVESEREPVVCYVPNEVDVSLRVLLALFVIGFGVWIVLTWLKYDKSAAQSEQGWHKGSRQMVELTLVKEDANKLACASNITVEGLNCAYDGKSQARVPPPPDDAHLLRPYCNVKNDVLLASGLWDSPGMRAPLPNERFTVVCNYDVVGVVKAVSLRWNPNDKFDPAKQSLPVGTLTDCAIPQ